MLLNESTCVANQCDEQSKDTVIDDARKADGDLQIKDEVHSRYRNHAILKMQSIDLSSIAQTKTYSQPSVISRSFNKTVKKIGKITADKILFCHNAIILEQMQGQLDRNHAIL